MLPVVKSKAGTGAWVAAKFFVFVFSRKFREIINIVFREIFLHEIEIWANFREIRRKFRETRNI